MTDTLTIRLLDREVVLKRDKHGCYRGMFNGSNVACWSCTDRGDWFRCQVDRPVHIDAYGHSVESASADLDTKLRQLREWLR